MPAPDELVLTNATVADPTGLRRGVDVHLSGRAIVGVLPSPSRVADDVERVDCSDRVIVPGYVNAHHHFATVLLRGMPTAARPRNQRERLQQVIWPFERGLTQADVRLAVEFGALEAIASGTTAVVDHHVSSGCVPGVLDVVAEALTDSGLRGVVCYEITDRDGPSVAAAGLAETARFLDSAASRTASVRGMVGLHAMSTVGPETLRHAARLAERFDVGIHLHLGESAHDNEDSVAEYGGRPLERLLAQSALTPKSIAAHAIHVTPREIVNLAQVGAAVAHCPRSNATNGVGVTDLASMRAAGIAVGIGGDGFTQDIRGDLGLIPLFQRLRWQDPGRMPDDDVVNIGMGGSAEVLRRASGWVTGGVGAGVLADLVALSYEPTVPLLDSNVRWHCARGFPGSTVRDVWVGGRRLLRDGVHEVLDQERILHQLNRWQRLRLAS